MRDGETTAEFKPLYTLRDTADLLGIGIGAVRALLGRQELEGVRTEKRWRWVLGASLRRFLDGRLQ